MLYSFSRTEKGKIFINDIIIVIIVISLFKIIIRHRDCYG